MFSEQSKPIGDAPRPPFLTLKRALKETFDEVRRHLAEKREKGTPLPAIEALAEVRHAFTIVFQVDKRHFSEKQHAELDALNQHIGASISAVETLVGVTNLWLSSVTHDERFALDHAKLNLDAILEDAQPRFV